MVLLYLNCSVVFFCKFAGRKPKSVKTFDMVKEKNNWNFVIVSARIIYKANGYVIRIGIGV